MQIKDLLIEYLDEKVTAINVIRQLSAMFDPKHAIDILTVINQIARVEEGDLGKDILRSMLNGEE